MAKKKKKGGSLLVKLMGGLIALLIVASIAMVWLCWNVMNLSPDSRLGSFGTYETMPEPSTEETEPTQTEPPTETEPLTTRPYEPEHSVASATLGAMGDIMMDLPILNASEQRDGAYDFDPIFQYLQEYSRYTDYAVANLETTLAGTETGYRYTGFGNANCPDEIVSSLQKAGFDMVLTANEHCYDTGLAGLQRTIQVIEKSGMEALGTSAVSGGAKYSIVDLNGIRVGMLAYTVQDPVPNDGIPGRVYLNGHLVEEGEEGYMSSFLSDRPDLLFADIQAAMDEMKAQGAEATVLYLHWGKLYSLKTADYQQAIAQRLCDMGVDVIVGSHPHVVEPVEILTSASDPSHHMACFYSLGNAVSNQRYGTVKRISSAHTEDGAWATFTLEKYSDGKVYVKDVQIVPLWMDMRTTIDRSYQILPLDEQIQSGWDFVYELNENELKYANSSFKRTTNAMGKSVTAAREQLAAIREQREADYFAAWVR